MKQLEIAKRTNTCTGLHSSANERRGIEYSVQAIGTAASSATTMSLIQKVTMLVAHVGNKHIS